MRKKFNNPQIKFYIVDMRDKESVDSAMKGVDYVFHDEIANKKINKLNWSKYENSSNWWCWFYRHKFM